MQGTNATQGQVLQRFGHSYTLDMNHDTSASTDYLGCVVVELVPSFHMDCSQWSPVGWVSA